jgi:hypothetical protein
MSFRQGQVLDEYKRPVPGSNIYVYDPLGDLAVVASGDTALHQPLVTDDFGYYSYEADDGIYREDTFYGGKLRYREVVAVGQTEIGLLDLVKLYAEAASASAIAAAEASVGPGLPALPRLTFEMYGAVGYPLGSNDAPAIHAAGAALSALGRGALDGYPGRKYIVGGGQVLSPGHQTTGYAFPPVYDYVLDINGCTGPVVINLNGATFQCANGVKYGTFNDDGTNKGTVSPYLGGGLAAPYSAMIRVENCTGQVTIRGGELDGNIANAVIGGEYDVAGRQIEYSGLMLSNNAVGPIIDGVKSHHHGLDGITINGPGVINLRENGIVRNSDFLNNGRGNSFVGGNGWLFENSRFNETGRDLVSMTYTGPGCGLDIEAEGGRWCKNITFKKCENVDNIAIGINAPVDTSAFCSNIHFEEHRFIGTTSFACWVYAPYVTYERCLFVGSITGTYSSASNPASSTKFKKSTFNYDLGLSPTGIVYAHAGGLATFFDWTFGTLVEFDECDVVMTSSGVNPTAGTYDTRWRNSTFRNLTAANGINVYGLSFEGQDTFFHNISTHPDPVFVAAHGAYAWAGMAFDSFQWEDTRTGTGGPYALARYEATGDKETGKRIYRGSTVYDPPSLAAGAKTAIQTMSMPGVALGDKVEDVSFSVNLAGARVHAGVSAANTVSYYFINENGANPLDLASGTLLVKVRQT